MLWKNESMAKLCWLIPLRLVLDGLAGAQLLMKGKPALTWAVVRAHWNFFGKLSFWTKKRRVAQQICRPDLDNYQNNEGVYKGSIIWDYFVKGVRKFSDLKF